MGFLSRLFGLDRTTPVDETRRGILKTAAVSPLFIPILSGLRENIDRPPSDKTNMLDFMRDVLVVTLLKDEMTHEQSLRMAINGIWITAPYRRQIYIQRGYVEMLLRTRRCEGIDNRVRYPMTIHHDPAGETGRAWLESIVRAA